MLTKVKELFYLWAYLDVEKTSSKKGSYFGRFPDEIGVKNLQMVRSIAVCFLIISTFVICTTMTYFGGTRLRNLYLLIFVLESVVVCACTILIKHKASNIICNIFTSVYLLHMLAFGGYIGVTFSLVESATVFVAVLVAASVIFILPAIWYDLILTAATVCTLFASYLLKPTYWFQSDFINCIGVLILSLLISWRVNKIRADEAFARWHAFTLTKELQKAVITDMLTGLPNHRSFQDDYYKMFEQAKATGTRLGVIMIDIDKFKEYNDNYGHVNGDECLRNVSNIFAININDKVKVYRYGGEEFIALISDDGCDTAVDVATAFKNALENMAIPHDYSEVSKIITVSMGLYIGVPTSEHKPMDFVDNADKAMYHSKRTGSNKLTAKII